MTVGEAHCVNVICRALLGTLAGTSIPEPTEEQLVSALATLAERASKTLQAGYSGGLVVARREQLHLRYRQEP